MSVHGYRGGDSALANATYKMGTTTEMHQF